jgi:hypothetical protein
LDAEPGADNPAAASALAFKSRIGKPRGLEPLEPSSASSASSARPALGRTFIPSAFPHAGRKLLAVDRDPARDESPTEDKREPAKASRALPGLASRGRAALPPI